MSDSDRPEPSRPATAPPPDSPAGKRRWWEQDQPPVEDDNPGLSIGQAFRRAMLGVALIGGGAIAAIAIFIGYCAYTLPLSAPPAPDTPQAATIFAAADGRPLTARGVYHGDALSADQLPRDLANAVVAIEDRRFFEHGAIDPLGILRAGVRDIIGGGAVEGGSTITQQLARVAYLSQERTMRRKVQEVMLAFWLESRLSKKEILARYLNSVYFGAGAYGADAAAKRYFGKKATELDLSQSVMLAGLIRAPSQLAPNRNPDGARQRAVLVSQAMVEAGYIDKRKAEQVREHPVALAVPPDAEPGENYFIDAADSEVRRLMGPLPLDLSVATTLDERLQRAAEQTVARWLDGEGAKRHVGQAALVAMAPDGAILAMVGGRDYKQSQFNRVTQAHRQPGSLFKVVVYLAALNNGYTPDSVLVDQPIQIGDWQPKDYEGTYRGPVNLRTAFADSINTISAQLVQAVGVDKVIALAKSLGVQSQLDPVPSIALGTDPVTLMEMARVMDAIAIDSKSVEPYLVRNVAAPTGQTLYTRPETGREPPPWNRVGLMRLLEAVVTEGTGKAAKLEGRRTAGKTGTTQEYRDAWFVGFTTDLVVGVWVGNDDNSPTDGVTGGDIPAKIWHDFAGEAERILATPPQKQPPQKEAPPPAAAPVVAAAAPEPPPPPQVPDNGSGSTSAPPENPAPDTAPMAAAAEIRGVPKVIDTGTLEIHGTTVHLSGIDGEAGEAARNLNRYIRHRRVVCAPVDPEDTKYRCLVGDYDLAEAVLLNGGGHATADASDRLRAAEQSAQAARRGIWR
ncbi:MAG TPA: PBP1A family penicillin-binding protein [Stellaceae bacterium]|nr:PBP1A family penicillin-binding protein [Stellaceae bacterium]